MNQLRMLTNESVEMNATYNHDNLRTVAKTLRLSTNSTSIECIRKFDLISLMPQRRFGFQIKE